MNVGTKTQTIGAQGHVGIDMVTPVFVWVCVWVCVCGFVWQCVGVCGSACVSVCMCAQRWAEQGCLASVGLSWGSLGALLGLSEALLGLSWRARPF